VLLSLVMLAGCAKTPETRASNSSYFQYEQQQTWAQVAGKMQSPINIIRRHTIPFDRSGDAGVIEIAYDDTASNIVDNGHSIQVTHGGKARMNGRTFALRQFHFHAPSEHTIDGVSFPLEAHFVNKAQDGRVAVLAVFFDVGASNKAFDTVLYNVDNKLGAMTLDPSQLMPTNKSYYHYLGSLTTPPLTENVEWYVLQYRMQISEQQLREFQLLYDHNNRAIQPLNERVVLAFEA